MFDRSKYIEETCVIKDLPDMSFTDFLSKIMNFSDWMDVKISLYVDSSDCYYEGDPQYAAISINGFRPKTDREIRNDQLALKKIEDKKAAKTLKELIKRNSK